MNLVIDIGNSSSKVAVYDGQRQLSVFRTAQLTFDELEKILHGRGIKSAIVSSVKELPPFITPLLLSSVPYVHILSYRSKLPFRIEYETPETLGTDRIAAVAGAFNLFPSSEVLVIDAGTAITYDFLSNEVYKGGNISPGLGIRFRALNEFTGRLPLVARADNFTFPGRNTNDSILAGVITGVTYEINEYIRTFEKNIKDLKIFLTGGDSGFLKDKINHQFTYVPDIVIDGLNYILEYNAV